MYIHYSVLKEKIAAGLISAGVNPSQAEIEAEIMVESDLLGVASHGVRMLPGLLKAIETGRVNPQPEIKFLRNFGAISVVDFGNSPGRYASYIAMNTAIEKAKNFGVGVCLAKNTSHWGRAHAYASRAAQAGYIGICTTNAIPSMAIAGAKQAVIGNNPLAIAVPTAQADEPIVLDIAMSQAAVGKVGTWLREGKSIPENWGINADGKPTQDAKEILSGAVLPMGEHKGAGLAVMIELLTAALAGAALTFESWSRDQSGVDPESTKLFIALSPDAFVDRDLFNQRSRDLISYLKESASPFSYPGERGWETRKIQLVKGIDLHTEIVSQLEQVGIHF
jgi:LDH2 family malate/lactate/ureidoglycolate dehydrogenase